MIVTISKGQQITIPAKYRKEFNLKVGSRAELVKEGNKLVIRPIDSGIDELFRNARKVKPRHGFTAKQMDEEVENAVLGR